jgi:predicted dehydrogenase
MSPQTTRRQFLKQTTLAGVGFWVAGGVSPAAGRSANEKLNIACIGVGGRGGVNLGRVSGENVVALCDVDEVRLNRAADKHPAAKKYFDYRKMLEQKDIDAVVVSTPDHTHAPASLMAMRLGKHVYCEKPLTHTIAEARLLQRTAAEMKVATQMGNQGTAQGSYRRAVDWVQAGAIGPVRAVHIWTNRPIWPQGIGRPRLASAPPPSLLWDLWLGTAPERPYALFPADMPIPATLKEKKCPYHPFNWRGWCDFGTGALGDMGCHLFNLAFRALRLGYPTSVEAASPGCNGETYPTWSTVTYQFPARADLPPVELVWYDGLKDGKPNVPPPDALKGLPKLPDEGGTLLIGDRGLMFSPNETDNFRLLPEDRFKDYKDPAPTLPPSPGHHQEWIRACKGGAPALANFTYAALLTEVVLLGNVAVRVGKKLEWDGPNMKVTYCPEADQYLRCEYRKGWSL